MSETWAIVAAALGSSSLTIFGSFWLEYWRLAKANQQAGNERLREACCELGSHALALGLRAETLYRTARIRSGLGEGLDVVLYHRKPLDPMGLADWLSEDLQPMLTAQTAIEVMGSRELIRSAADLVLAALAVLHKAGESATPGTDRSDSLNRGLRDRLRRLMPFPSNPALEDAIQDAMREVGRRLRAFASLTRDQLGVNDPDAVILAFPELFADQPGQAQP